MTTPQHHQDDNDDSEQLTNDDESSELSSEEVDRLLNKDKSKKYRRPKHKCEYCDRMFSSRQPRDYHIAVARCFGTLYTCKRCLKSFVAPWRLERHQRQQVRCKKHDKVMVTRNGNQYTTEAC